MRFEAGDEHATDEDAYGLRHVEEHPIRNVVMFTIMRVVRLALALVCEVLTLVAGAAVAVYGFFTACWAGAWVLTIVYYPAALAFGYEPMANPFHAQFNTPIPEGYVREDTWPRWLLMHPYVPLIPAWLITITLMAQTLAFGVPYRWKNSPPGLEIVRCLGCKKEMANIVTCPSCETSRFEEFILLKGLWALNVGITSLWVAHDVLFGFLGVARGK